ncbi:hypothetical protein SmJEL517_g05148 [Synchytrium microbalum]|uniref:Ubiquinol-cytochrome c chaperone domain-containing protein n=1 Tax=Synchytrium microbalum TaxID=1806994 RepID=A0A507BXI0_9FUNG|nr:uncharacterized protein SmJEL517_g05148 [Synchytrium microbalum]TPX31559.1 hypothetical protein SmJEL517_g05148 [Synchytrium microbalum]
MSLARVLVRSSRMSIMAPQAIITIIPRNITVRNASNRRDVAGWRMNKIDSARVAYEKCSHAFENNKPFFVKELGLPDAFSSWFAITVLHVWMYTARLRAEQGEGKELSQEIFNHLWLDVEMKLHKAGVKHRINARITELLGSFYGQTLAYDEGLATSDAIFAAALYRNVFGGREVKPTTVEALLKYVRSKVQVVDSADSAAILDGSVAL